MTEAIHEHAQDFDPVLQALAAAPQTNAKPGKADTQKNRLDLLRAVESRKIPAIMAYLDDLEMNPNFLMERQGEMHSPLSLAVSMGHEEEAKILLEHKANQTASRKQFFLEHPEADQNFSCPNPSASACFQNNFSLALRILVSEQELADPKFPANLSSCAGAAARHGAETFKLFVAQGFHTPQAWEDCRERILQAGNSTEIKWMCENPEPMNLGLKTRQRIWKRAVALDDPNLVAWLARAGLGLGHCSWTLSAGPGDYAGARDGWAPAEFICATGRSWEPFRKTSAAAQPIPLALFAASIGSHKILKKCLEAAPLAQALSESPLKSAFASCACNSQTLRLLLQNGFAPSDFADAEGNTPLHRLMRSGPSKTAAEALMKACPDLITAKNAAGKTPLDLARASGMANEMTRIAETIALKNQTGGKFKPSKPGRARSI